MDWLLRQEIKQGKFVNDSMLQTTEFCVIPVLTGFVPKAQSQIQQGWAKLAQRIAKCNGNQQLLIINSATGLFLSETMQFKALEKTFYDT